VSRTNAQVGWSEPTQSEMRIMKKEKRKNVFDYFGFSFPLKFPK